jgi:hypothetical protein
MEVFYVGGNIHSGPTLAENIFINQVIFEM